jgi:hypothetical protein
MPTLFYPDLKILTKCRVVHCSNLDTDYNDSYNTMHSGHLGLFPSSSSRDDYFVIW